MGNPLSLIDLDGREPIKPLVGTINQAIDLFRSRNFTTVEQIDNFYENPTNQRGERITTGYTRYVYTDEKGWIDLRHYFGTILRGELAMDLLENTQCLGGLASCYSYEDLASNDFGGNAPVYKPAEFTVFGKRFTPMTGNDLFNAIEGHFKSAGAKSPLEAPNYSILPMRERPKVPDVKETFWGIPSFYTSEEKREMIETGDFVPQNFSETPYDLNNFPTPGAHFLTPE